MHSFKKIVGHKWLLFGAIIGLLWIVSSCATVSPPRKAGWYDESSRRLEIVHHAYKYLGIVDLASQSQSFRNDCSGYVLGVYKSSGYRVSLVPAYGHTPISQLLYDTLHRRGLIYRSKKPQRADVVFFRGTTRVPIRGVSHVGLVYDLLPHGTVLILHYGSRGVSLIHMNLNYPHLYRDKSGKILNDFIVKRSKQSNPRGLLSGEHFVAYGDLFRYVSSIR